MLGVINLKKIIYKKTKEILKHFNGKAILINIMGIITQTINIQNSKIYFYKNKLIINECNTEKINIDINWVANFYSNEDNTIVKLEFDQTGYIEIHII